MARTIGQLVVGGIGYAVGGPLGFAVANTLFGMAFAPKNESAIQRFGDTNLQGSQLGTFLPQIYGQMGKVQGNIIDCSRDKDGKAAGILIRVKEEKVGGGGKGGGGGGQTQRTEVGYLTAAYMLGEGPLYVDRIVKMDGSDIITIYDRYGANNKARGGTFTPEFDGDDTLISESSDKIKMYFGTEQQGADTILQGFHSSLPAYRGVCYVLFNQYEIPSQPTFQFYVRSPLTGREEIITKKFNDAVVPHSRRDLHNLWGYVNGAWVTSRVAGRPLCEALAKMCYTDFVASNGVIMDASKVFPYVWSIPKAQMGAYIAGQEPPDALPIEMRGEEEFITDLSIPFNDFDLNYADNSAHAVLYNKEQLTPQQITLPISARLQEMVPFAKTLQGEDQIQNRTAKTATMPENIKISVGEVVKIPDIKFPVSDTVLATTDYYITEQDVSPEGIAQITGTPYLKSNYTGIPGDSYTSASNENYTLEGIPVSGVPNVQVPLGVVLDGVPLTDEMADSTSIISGECAPLLPSGAQTHWGGGSVIFDSNIFSNLAMSLESSLGKTTTAYSYDEEEVTRFNYDKSITITMHNGSLNSSTEDKVLNNFANVLALNDGTPGNTLYIQFVNATLISANTYEITGLLTGRKGSDYVTSIPIDSYALLMTNQDGTLLSAAQIASTSNANIGNAYGWKYYATDEIFGGDHNAVLDGNTRVPLSPVYIRKTGRAAGTSITIDWCYRTRYAQGVSWMQTRASDPDDALLEFTDVSGLGETVVHSLIVTGASQAVITEADLTAWYGTLPSSLMVNVSQIGTITGAGHRRAFTTPL